MGNAASTPPPAQPPWRALLDAQAVADTIGTLQRQVTSARSLALYDSLASHVADATTGGVVFWLGLSAAQVFQRALRVGAATPVAASMIGTLAVASSSVLALHFASFPREVGERYLLTNGGSFQPSAVVNASKEISAKLKTRMEDLKDAPFPVYMAMGVLSFKMLGGRMSSLAPSHYANLGAFHLKKASLPATEEYADSVGRGIIQEFGRLYGCHTCGIKRGVQYHADHMPPKFVAKKMNEAWWRRLTGTKVPFRFYPQCSPCSNQQATVVKMGRSDLKLHLSALRLYHTTGFWLVLLCTGGLYVGGSSFQETADVQPSKKATGDRRDEDVSIDASSSDHALLVSLRLREKKIRRQRRAFGDDKELVATLDAELHTIEECKQRLKDTLRRQQQKKQ